MSATDSVKAILASAEGEGARGNSIYPLLRSALLALAAEVDKKSATFTPTPIQPVKKVEPVKAGN